MIGLSGHRFLIPSVFSTLLLLITPSARPEATEEADVSVRKAAMPLYPACAIDKRVQGLVTIRTRLNGNGRVVEAVPVQKGEPITFPGAKTDSQFGYDLKFQLVLVTAIPAGEDLGPSYTAPFDVEVRGLLPLVSVVTSN